MTIPAVSAISAASAKRQRLLSYWWAPITVVILILMGYAYLQPHQELDLADLPEQVQANAATLDKSLGSSVNQSFKYTTRRTYSSNEGPLDVEIRATLTPLGGGLFRRNDDWVDIKTQHVVYQERFILFRNLFTLHIRNREVAPAKHDFMGRLGWYNDTTKNMQSTVQGKMPANFSSNALWSLDVVADRLSDTDGQGLLRSMTPYKRTLHCERVGDLPGSDIGAAFKGSYPKVTCRSIATNQTKERRSDYAYLPEHDIFLLLNYQQQLGTADQLGAKANYTSFVQLPQTK
jgi:hypothetical protein